MSSNPIGAIYALVAFGVFATHDVVIKFLGGIYSPFQIIFFATLISFPLSNFMLMRDQTHGTLRPVHPWWSALRTACAVGNGMCAFYAFSVLPLAQTYAILFAAPLLITLLAIPMLGERVGWKRGMAVVVGLMGVLVVLRPGAAELSLGHFAAMGSAVLGATSSIIVRKIGRDERAVVLMLYPMAANFILMSILLGFVYRPMPVQHLGMMGLISVMGFAAGLCLIVAYRKAEAAIVAPMQYSQILWATFYGYLIFDESVDLPTLLGAGIIIASGIFIVLRENRISKASQTPVLRTRSRVLPTSFRISPFLRGGKVRN